MAGLRRTDIIGLKLISPVETGLVRFNPVRSGVRRSNPAKASFFYTGPARSGSNNLDKSGFDLSNSIKSGLSQCKPDRSGSGHSKPVQSGLGLTQSDSSGPRDSRSPDRTGVSSPVANGAKRPLKRSSANDGSTPEGASIPAKRRRTGLHQSGLNGARKLVTSIFGWRGPEVEVGNVGHDCQRIRTTDGVSTSAKDDCQLTEETVSMNFN